MKSGKKQNKLTFREKLIISLASNPMLVYRNGVITGEMLIDNAMTVIEQADEILNQLERKK